MSSPPIEFFAAFRRWTEPVTQSLGQIERALGVIQSAHVLPAIADQLRANAKVGTVHYSNLIEGNTLDKLQAARATRGELEPTSQAALELVNYVGALDLIDDRLAAGTLDLTPQFLKDLHRATTRGLGRENDPHFKPRHEGEWRDGRAVVVDRLRNAEMHVGPPPEEVDARIRGMFDWLHNKLERQMPPFVIAGVMHYGITDIHPFADGNGRVARLFQTAVLMKADVLPGRMFSFESYYAEDRDAYYEALRSVQNRTHNMENWLDYFLRGLAEEYQRVATAVQDLRFLSGGNEPFWLNESQQNGLTALRIEGKREFSRADFEKAAGVDQWRARRDLTPLVEQGIVRRLGSGPRTRYAFGTEPPPAVSSGSGRSKGWTDSRIEKELREFVSGQSRWPAYQDFVEAGRRDLYAAASRNGGIRRWRSLISS